MTTVDGSITIDSDFPSGNIIVDRRDDDAVYLHQDLRDTEIWWFYWHFRVRHAARQTLTFHFTQGDVIGSQGPALSTDAGQTWRWLGREAVTEASFTHDFADDENEVHFAFAPAYVEADLARFLARWQGHPALRLNTLCTTPAERVAEYLQIGRLDGQPKHRILLTCRHHACESVASYVLEGLMEAVLEAEADWQDSEFLIVPFVDKDGVEQGDQGKQRHPRDHNRDYEGTSLYATTGALRHLVPAWSEGKLRVALDLHCPYIRGESAEVVYCVGGANARNWAAVQRFSDLLEDLRRGPHLYRAKDNMPFGVGWNTAENMAQGMSFAGWAAELPGMWMATTIETPYATIYDQPVLPATARALGRDLAHVLHRYLEMTRGDERSGG